PVPNQLVDETADLVRAAGELDGGPVRTTRKDLGASLDERLDLRSRDRGHDELAVVQVIAGQVLDLEHLDQPLELLAHLVSLGVPEVNLQRAECTAGL